MLYDQVPDVGCKGLCQSACGPIDMAPREGARLRAAGVEIPATTRRHILLHVTGKYSCPALDADGRCEVYAKRPMICRLWGATETLRCPYGCAPERWLSDVDALDLIAQTSLVGGDADAGRRASHGAARVRDDPTLQRWLRDFLSTQANLDKTEAADELTQDGSAT